MQDDDFSTIEDILAAANEAWEAGKPQEALALYTRAVDHLTETTPKQLVVSAKRSYALCLCDLGDFDSAMPIYAELDKLCREASLDPTLVLRQWAKAFEQTGQFKQARLTYERVRPHAGSSRDDKLKWEHGFGLLNWREGRLSEAAANLAAATDALPQDPVEASKVLAVLGNDAMLSIHLGDLPRAYRLVERMISIRAKVEKIPLSSEVNLFKVRALLADQRGDAVEEAAILRSGMDLVEERATDYWMRKLDLAADYVAAAKKSDPSDEPIKFLSDLCAKAPPEVAWIGAFILAQLQVKTGDTESVRANIAIVMAAFVGSGAAAGETEILAILAGLANALGAMDASIFLGKMTLKGLIAIAGSFDGAELRKIIAVGHDLIVETTHNLEGEGRFEEAFALRNLFDRVRRYTLVLSRGDNAAKMPQPVPLGPQEAVMEAQWLAWRERYAAMRESIDNEAMIEEALAQIDVLLTFESKSGLGPGTGLMQTPPPGVLRLRLLPKGMHCEVQYLWHDRFEALEIPVSEQALFHKIAELRDGLSDAEAWRTPSKDLFDWILAPASDALGEVSCLEVEGAGILGRVPMALLFDGAECFVQRLPIRYVLDAPLQPSVDIARLGFAHCSPFPISLETVANDETTPLIASDFTRDAFLAAIKAHPRYLSVLTHLETEPARPDLASLLLGDDTSIYLPDLASDQFDLRGLEIAVFAACSSGVDDPTQEDHTSLAALMLEKGVACFIGTLWQVSQSSAQAFVESFWQTLAKDTTRDPSEIVAQIQSAAAADLLRETSGATISGGIGHPGQRHTPDDWAAFAVFQNGNLVQPGANPAAQ